jgi:membrane protein implicated in regulation of membrane protease activity
VNRRRDLLLANLAALLLLVVVLLLGWWQEAAFGLAVLLFLDLYVFLRARQARSGKPRSAQGTDGEHERSEPGEEAEPE